MERFKIIRKSMPGGFFYVLTGAMCTLSNYLLFPDNYLITACLIAMIVILALNIIHWGQKASKKRAYDTWLLRIEKQLKNK